MNIHNDINSGKNNLIYKTLLTVNDHVSHKDVPTEDVLTMKDLQRNEMFKGKSTDISQINVNKWIIMMYCVTNQSL